MSAILHHQAATPTNIAVIGAGLAGLSCARSLQTAGLNVTVFEKARGVGGRMSTRRTDDDFQCDHGAQYFTARDPLFVAELERWIDAGAAQQWHPVLHRAEQSSSDISTKKETRRFVGTPGMNAPLHFLSQELNIFTSTMVTGITRRESLWHVQTVQNDSTATHQFDAVILAIPSPQAGVLLPDSCHDLRMLCEQHTMFACWALMLRFDQRVAIDFDAMFVNTGPLSWIARNSSKPGRPESEVWLLHASRAWSAEHLEDSPEQVSEVLQTAFCEATGLAMTDCAPSLWSAHRWRYSQAEATTNLPGGACLPGGASLPGGAWDHPQLIGVCGDWLHGGRVEGAWLSGHQVAQQLLMSR